MQVYNRCLKDIGKALGFRKSLHSHLARHTFATWALRNGVPIEYVSKMLGHTNIKQTQRYAKVMPLDVFREFDKLAEKTK
jgi:site-specific recombinase XerD